MAMPKNPFANVLTERDIQISRMVLQGMERDEIAKKLNTSRATVNRHLTKVLHITDSRTMAQAGARLVAAQIVEFDDVVTEAMADALQWKRAHARSLVLVERLTDPEGGQA